MPFPGMRALIQRVSNAKVSVDQQVKGQIGRGFLIFLGVGHKDGPEDMEWLSQKISKLRVFRDSEGLMNLNINEVQGDILLISQFTLYANIKKGNRPSFTQAATPEIANALYERFSDYLTKAIQGRIEKGVFGADMQVELCNSGPVTLWMDSKKRE